MSRDKGELAIQTLAMPSVTNANGDIFGGWLVSQMDLAAGVLAKRLAKGRVATVAIDGMSFLKPVHVGDIVQCYVHLLKCGRSSMTIAVEAWVQPAIGGDAYCVTRGTFTFVAINEQGQSRALATDG
ncbi:MAG: acyl-CoA thioesterase [Legionellaceae bacterium]|nr:acyl-CoA thioesterase [Legionellaceae bacterium]